jgi:hypothetical protein
MSHGFQQRRWNSPTPAGSAALGAGARGTAFGLLQAPGDRVDLTFCGDPNRRRRSHLSRVVNVGSVDLGLFNFFILLTQPGDSDRSSVRVMQPNPDNGPRRAERKCALATGNATAPELFAQRLLGTTLSGMSLREAYRGRRAHCRPPFCCAPSSIDSLEVRILCPGWHVLGRELRLPTGAFGADGVAKAQEHIASADRIVVAIDLKTFLCCVRTSLASGWNSRAGEGKSRPKGNRALGQSR